MARAFRTIGEWPRRSPATAAGGAHGLVVLVEPKGRGAGARTRQLDDLILGDAGATIEDCHRGARVEPRDRTLAIIVDDWRRADAAIAAIGAELERWDVGDSFWVSIEPPMCGGLATSHGRRGR